VAPPTSPAPRRESALSRQRIIDAAIELLDDKGEVGLTFRALATRLSTGPGAIYWHVTNKGELLTAAAASALAPALTARDQDTPQDTVRRAALGVFDSVRAHPWIGGQLAGPASQRPAMLTILERLGQQVSRLGVPPEERFAIASALLNYILGVAAHEAANQRHVGVDADRAAILAAESLAWQRLDPATYPFLHEVSDRMSTHDDREQFLTGIDLILAGITSPTPWNEPDAP